MSYSCFISFKQLECNEIYSFLKKIKAAAMEKMNEIAADEQPRDCCCGHGNEIIFSVGLPFCLVQLEFTSDIDHNEGKTDVQHYIEKGFEVGVDFSPEKYWKYL